MSMTTTMEFLIRMKEMALLILMEMEVLTRETLTQTETGVST